MPGTPLACKNLNTLYIGSPGERGKMSVQELINERVHDYYWQDDFCCAVTTLKVLSEIYNLELQPQVSEAAFGLNAGRCGFQCGLVEGTLLFIGVYGSRKQMDNKTITASCRLFCQQFQEQFGSMLCSQLRPAGFSPVNPPHLCEGLTKQALLFSMEFIEKNIGK